MNLLKSKSGFVLSYADLFKGLVIGFILGVVLMVLAARGVITIPFVTP